MIQKFEAIIFDLGGVVLNLDYTLTSNAFKALGISNFDDLYSQAVQNHVFDDFETGQQSPDEFRQYIRTQAGIPLTDQDIDQAWNAMLLDLPQYRVDLLKRLAKQYPIYLYSNTNAIHLKAFQAIIGKAYGKPELLEDIFKQTYYSHILGMRKPNPEAFQKLLEREGLTAEKTLFIDDSSQHIEGANSIGLQTYHLVNEDIRDLFAQI